MTFLCGPDRLAGVAQHELGAGWPKPWAIRCDECGRVLEYGAGYQVGPDLHRCDSCKKRPGQLTLEAAIT